MQQIKILVVEDEFVIATDLQDILEQHVTNTVLTAVSVPEAVEIIEQETPDLVLLDIMLQDERSGIELGQLLTARYRIPFIYLTSHADKLTLQRAVATQPYGYILKPFQEAEILTAIELALAHSKVNQLAQEKAYLTEELRATHNVEHIVGQAPALNAALTLVRQVAPHNMTTLLLGETGTGKELFARAIHDLSPRSSQALVKVNCAALPPQLIESELFGHEKGAFTGANQRRVGKFELAHKGTIFLDEIGELPLELQVKLLRVLQEKEIERVGGTETLVVDVRVIAATNRVLEDEVQAGRFRADLYYRLNIFPILIPALRERRSDIPLLAEFFLQRASKQLGKLLTGFAPRAMLELQQYAWPGNVRELQHVVERAALLATSPEVQQLGLGLQSTLALPTRPIPADDNFVPRTLEDMERELILSTLRYCDGRVRGAGGAAECLQMQPTTLDARMRKLGIQKEMVVKK